MESTIGTKITGLDEKIKSTKTALENTIDEKISAIPTPVPSQADEWPATWDGNDTLTFVIPKSTS